MFKGIGVSPGIIIGRVLLFNPEEIRIIRHVVPEDRIEAEISRFQAAIEKTREELSAIKNRIGQEIGQEHANIFDAHLLILDDPILTRETINQVRTTRNNVEWVFSQNLTKFVKMIASLNGEYLKERSTDISDVGQRLLRHLTGREKATLDHLEEEVIVFAKDLSPSDTAVMDRKKVKGFATDIGGQTSHTAIMARALEIPAVVGLSNITVNVSDGDLVIVDGNQGMVIVNPGEPTLQDYRERQKQYVEVERRLERLRDLPAETVDGGRIVLAANIEIPDEIPLVHKNGANGIGLYRTEFLFLNRPDLPTEDEQFEAYKAVAQAMSPQAVIVRTLDVGGDKFLSNLGLFREMNPFLGLRAIRLCLAKPDIFKTQLRAILRASAFGNLKIMFPMISGIEELRQSKVFLEECREELKKEGREFRPAIPLGIMVEIPSAVWIGDVLAKEVNFFSVGTNDLIQYTLAIDRVNENIAYLYNPLHPAVIRSLSQIIAAAHQQGIQVGMCGEMAGDPLFIPILVGLGFDELSVAPTIVPEIKEVIRAVTLDGARKFTDEILGLSSAREISECLYRMVLQLPPDLAVSIQARVRDLLK